MNLQASNFTGSIFPVKQEALHQCIGVPSNITIEKGSSMRYVQFSSISHVTVQNSKIDLFYSTAPVLLRLQTTRISAMEDVRLQSGTKITEGSVIKSFSNVTIGSAFIKDSTISMVSFNCAELLYDFLRELAL